MIYLPSANYSSGGRDKKLDRSRDGESTKKCYGCNSGRHILRNCPRKQEYYDRRGADQQPESFHKISLDRKDNSPHPHLKSILKRKKQ